MLNWCKPVDLIALVAVIGGIVLMVLGACNPVCEMILLSIAAFYFGLKSTLPEDRK